MPKPTLVTRRMWETSDGKFFDSQTAAEAHEFEYQLMELISDLSWGRGGEWSTTMIVESMLENKHRFQELFNLLPELRRAVHD